ncbi:arginine repressor [Pediococcus claussenii]|uniref:Arginine repressor n=1 Tax=Pediococcus claussenii (strain ATCC BAA-344 / DSM 14800 / JCM 18046 / KCTC 3811 / LMG 21948 / P06) TaxID=701521 RepID=G8PDJ1_PEDCP|nr:arginine repressor, DNA-binding domain protein [Pediococcus claussenii]AEV95326.1 arginine repressor, DNA binding domain protein [Pediococcus claussenii ATCC BAA-344]ANZ68859.1 DNA-binding protein [Pediococcus claussenii]ANZ70675.1 DNA-binding protein [Pediococcus claussenii]KRN19492.1 hypothetical protein IV79_GL001209 [Pediococcus claussenii]
MQKSKRHEIIKNIIKEQNIEKQEYLVKALKQAGIEVTQATISRDIRELQLIKVPNGDGKNIYAVPEDNVSQLEQRVFDLLKRAMVAIRLQDKLIFIELRPGYGPSISAAFKQINYNFVFGILNDDNGVLVICNDADRASSLRQRITDMISYR